MMVLIWIAAFLGGFAYDLLWTRCVQAVEARRAVLAANVSVLIYACAVLVTLLVIDRAVVACVLYAVGAWLGTWVAVRYSRDS